MDGKYLLEKMDLVEPEYIEAADKLPRKKPLMLPQWAAFAACLAIACVTGFVMIFDNGVSVRVIPASNETASLFGGGGIVLALFFISLLAAAGFLAYILKRRKQ